MSISAINCSPLKPQVSFRSAQGVDEANKVLQLSKQLGDNFHKVDSEGNDIKNPLQTATSVLAACLAMFALGKGAGKVALTAAKKVPASAKKTIADGFGKVKTFVSKQAAKLPKNEKVTTVLNNTVGKASNAVKSSVAKAVQKSGAEKVFTTTAGVVAASTLVPKIVKADDNGDGIADIAQKSVNAYQSAFKSAEIFADMISALS